MRFVTLVFVTLLSTAACLAQKAITSADAPNLIVTEAGWHKEVYVPELLEDPMNANQQHADLERDQKLIMRENKTRVRSGQNQIPAPQPRISDGPNKEGRSVAYIYEAKVKNTGNKIIRSISWIYSFNESGTTSQADARRFTTEVNLRPGKVVTLAGASTTPPGRVVQVSKTKSEGSAKYDQHIIIDRIEFEDGSNWQRPSN